MTTGRINQVADLSSPSPAVGGRRAGRGQAEAAPRRVVTVVQHSFSLTSGRRRGPHRGPGTQSGADRYVISAAYDLALSRAPCQPPPAENSAQASRGMSADTLDKG